MQQKELTFFAFLLKAARAGAEVMAENGIDFRYPSYVQDILEPMCFDYGFGPFRWVCTSGKTEDLRKSDQIAAEVLKEIMQDSPVQSGNKCRITSPGLKKWKKISWS